MKQEQVAGASCRLASLEAFRFILGQHLPVFFWSITFNYNKPPRPNRQSKDANAVPARMRKLQFRKLT